MDLTKLESRIKAKEGYNSYLYKDTVGKWTIGYGRNIEDDGISPDEGELMLLNDIRRTVTDIRSHLPWWDSLDEVRQLVLAEMCYNMGINRLLGFTETLAAVQAGDYNRAADEMLNSLWARQVKDRAQELSDMMRSGVFFLPA